MIRKRGKMGQPVKNGMRYEKFTLVKCLFSGGSDTQQKALALKSPNLMHTGAFKWGTLWTSASTGTKTTGSTIHIGTLF